MLGSASAAINAHAQLCSDQVLWGMGEDPKILIIGASTKESLI